MLSYGHRHLRAMLDDLEVYSDKIEKQEVVKQDLKSIIIEILSYLKQNIDIADLDSRLMTGASVDKDDLIHILNIVKKMNLAPVSIGQINIEPKEIINDFEKFVSSIISQAPSADTTDLAIKIDLVGNRIFDEILLCTAQNKTSVKNIEKMVIKKLENVSEEVIFILWDRILSEFDENRRQPMIKDPKIINPNYLKGDDAKQTREKIAKYLVELKPRLLMSMFGKEIYTHPVEATGVVRILALRKEDVGSSISEWEILLARALSGLASLWENNLYEDINIIANVLGIGREGRILGGPDFKKARSDPAYNKSSMIFWELRKILHVTDSFISSEIPVERALIQYKLGLEVMCPEILQDIKKKNEKLLQKYLCRFLIERDIFAVGTIFGRSETDLWVGDSIIDCIIETKVYHSDDILNESAIRKDLTQLQSYMDQSMMQRRGVLVIYNMTDWLLDTPKIWLHHRYWILAINLQAKPPSGRRKTLTVEQSEDNNLIKVIINERQKSIKP